MFVSLFMWVRVRLITCVCVSELVGVRVLQLNKLRNSLRRSTSIASVRNVCERPADADKTDMTAGTRKRNEEEGHSGKMRQKMRKHDGWRG